MIRQLILMFILSIFIGLMLQSSYISIISTLHYNEPNYYIYLIAYTIGYGLLLFLLSIVIAIIPKTFYWLIQKKKSPDIITLSWIVWIVLVLLLLFYHIYDNVNNNQKKITPQEPANKATAEYIYNKLANSVYTLYSKNKNNKTIASGGAVAVSPEYLATNCHIITDGDHFTVVTNNSEQTGQLYSQHGDLCIITVPNIKFNPVEIRHSKEVDIGEDVYAIGNPVTLDKSISNGIISNKHDFHGITILQTNAAISPGSSGGGLFDHNGKLIGITSISFTENNAQNINFVLPTETIEAAILEPQIESTDASKQQSFAEDSSKSGANSQPETRSQPEISPSDKSIDIKILGEYGNDKVTLFYSQNTCMIAIPGRYKPNMITSIAIYFPTITNSIFIFSRVTKLNNVIKFFNWLNETNNTHREESKSFIFINNNLKPLQLMNVNNVKQPVYIYSINDSITKDLINMDDFTVQFYNYAQKGFMTSILFGLDGFTEALASYNKECSSN